MGIYRRVFAYFKPFFWPTFWGLLITLVTTGLSLLAPWPFKIIVDELLPGAAHFHNGVFTNRIEPLLGGPFSVQASVMILAASLIVLHVSSGLLGLGSNYLFIKVGLQALLRLRTDLYTALHALPLKFHDMRRSSDSSFRVAYDSQSIQTFYNRGFTSIFGSTVMLISALIIMWKMDWKLTAISMGVIPVRDLGAQALRQPHPHRIDAHSGARERRAHHRAGRASARSRSCRPSAARRRQSMNSTRRRRPA